MADTRTAPQGRDQETRETEDRVTEYRPPSNLPDPTPQDGYEFRWVRVAMLGEDDNRNVSMRMREGWEPCLAEDHPELMIMSDVSDSSRFENNVVIGGLMLCKCSSAKTIQGCPFWKQREHPRLRLALVAHADSLRGLNFAQEQVRWQQQQPLMVSSLLAEWADMTMVHSVNSK